MALGERVIYREMVSVALSQLYDDCSTTIACCEGPTAR